MRLYGNKTDLAKFRAFGCSANVYLNEERRLRRQGHALLMHIRMKNVEARVNTFPDLLRQSISALQQNTTSVEHNIQAVYSVDAEGHGIQAGAIR
jgi:hypothetical protein